MPNLHRGEIEAEIGGARRRLVLTLGALAELEAAFGADDLVALAERFGTGRLKARDLARIIGAGLRGAGECVSDDEVATMPVDGGAAGYVVRGGAARDVSASPATGRVSPFPWKEAIGIGLGLLRLSPDAFWRMTPRELALAIEAVTGRGAPLGRVTLDALMKRYPDGRRTIR
ncbi:MAG: phage tail assembly chaperone [Rhizobiales bacterium]|nr:phage tail assembly chaperone [Hyphomicrobiales bacterium]